MSRKTLFTASDGQEIAYYSWIPRNDVFGVVQIVHGMAEHAMRYDHFATKLRSKGFAVYGSDLRGHGQTAEGPQELGYLGPENGWKRTADDLFELTEIIKMEHPDKKVFLFGHSMGSFLARTLMLEKQDAYDGVILSGTAAHPGIAGGVGRLLAKAAVKKDGGKQPNDRLDAMTFGSYNKAFQPARTRFDWLSRDEAEVDAYIKDPLCGFVCTSQMFEDLFTALVQVNTKGVVEQSLNTKIPLLLVSGSADPVGKMGKGVEQVAALYTDCGAEDVTVKLFPEDRHEILNELDRNEVENFCINWLLERL
ncbi:MAG: alpha/beta hydrolase [Spirochaetota bacterium]